jgi:dsRNA-specific ribonuclease
LQANVTAAVNKTALSFKDKQLMDAAFIHRDHKFEHPGTNKKIAFPK